MFVEPPIATSSATALSIDRAVTMSRKVLPVFTSSISRRAARLASSWRSGEVARIEPLPGSARPIASHRQFIELAVNMPEQEPQVGHDWRSSSSSRSSVICPEARWPTPSNTEIRSSDLPVRASRPASIGPPETKIVGTLARAAPISMPGTILSQFGMQISASKQWARTIVSTESAMISREGREKCIPSCPITIPSSTPIVLNSNGMPPASRMASFTTFPNAWRWTWPGMMSTYELQTATNGRSHSPSFTWPVARSRLRCGARSIPRLIVSERMTSEQRVETKNPSS